MSLVVDQRNEVVVQSLQELYARDVTGRCVLEVMVGVAARVGTRTTRYMARG